MLLGLGTGSTARYFIAGLAGRDVTCIASSIASAEQARALGLRVIDELDRPCDLAVDGADEIDPELGLIKGRGGALFREKLLAINSERFVVVADDSKLVSRLGVGVLPVEILPFLWRQTARHFAERGIAWQLRGGEEAPFLTDNGFSHGTAVLLFSIQAWASLVSKPVWGLLMNRFHARNLSAVGFMMAAASMLGMLGAASTGSIWVMGAVLSAYGFGIGGTIPLQETVWAIYFGRAHLGEIRAVAMPFAIVFGAGGPLLAGALYDRSGSYQSTFIIFAAFSLVGFLLVLFARPPQLPARGVEHRR